MPRVRKKSAVTTWKSAAAPRRAAAPGSPSMRMPRFGAPDSGAVNAAAAARTPGAAAQPGQDRVDELPLRRRVDPELVVAAAAGWR